VLADKPLPGHTAYAADCAGTIQRGASVSTNLSCALAAACSAGSLGCDLSCRLYSSLPEAGLHDWALCHLGAAAFA